MPNRLVVFRPKIRFIQIRGGLEEICLPLPGLREHDLLCACRRLPMHSCRDTFRCQVSAGTASATCRCRCTSNRAGRMARLGSRTSSGATSALVDFGDQITKIYHQGARAAQHTFEQPCGRHHTFEHHDEMRRD